MSVLDGIEVLTFTGPQEQLGQFIDWQAGAIGVLKHYKLDTITRGAHMQREFKIELRVDFADPGKLPEIAKTLKAAARHVLATAKLISDNPKSTDIAVFSDDFFSGREEISLLDDVIQQGLDETDGTPTDQPSDELLNAFK